MRAIAVSAFRAEPCPVELPKPDPGAGEVRVKVEYAALNPLDWQTADCRPGRCRPAGVPARPGHRLRGPGGHDRQRRQPLPGRRPRLRPGDGPAPRTLRGVRRVRVRPAGLPDRPGPSRHAAPARRGAPVGRVDRRADPVEHGRTQRAEPADRRGDGRRRQLPDPARLGPRDRGRRRRAGRRAAADAGARRHRHRRYDHGPRGAGDRRARICTRTASTPSSTWSPRTPTRSPRTPPWCATAGSR